MKNSMKSFLVKKLGTVLPKILLNDFDLGDVPYAAMGMLLSGNEDARNEMYHFYMDRVEIQRNMEGGNIICMDYASTMSYKEFKAYIEQKEVTPLD